MILLLNLIRSRYIISIYFLVFSLNAKADELSLGAGAGVIPRFTGAKSYHTVPYVSFSYKTKDFSVHSEGTAILVNLVSSGKLDFGPLVRFDFGRKNTRDPVLNLLPNVGTSIDVGLYLGSGIPLSFLGMSGHTVLTGRAEISTDVAGGHHGTLAEGAVGLINPVTDNLKLVGSISTTWASARYTQAYFEVTNATALASGLSVYAPTSGFNTAALSGVADYKFSPRWSVISIGRYSRLIGSATNSPIVLERGSVNQLFFGLALKYKVM